MSIKRQVRPDSKVPELSDLLYQLALERGPNAKLPRVKELCEMFGTTTATLNEALYVLEEKQIIVRRQGSGIFVSSRIHRKSICVLLYSRLFLAKNASPFWGIFWALLVQEMEMRMASGQQYYSLHFVMRPSEAEQSLPPDEPSLPEDVVSMVFAGKVHAVLSVGLEHQTLQWLQRMGIPAVTYAGLGTVMVQSNPQKDIELALLTLIQQGCHRIGLWVAQYSNTEPPVTEGSLYQFFQATLHAHGLTVYPALARYGVSQKRVTMDQLPGTYQERGYELARDVFTLPRATWPDGLYIADDMMTHGALAALRLMGIQVGQDVHIISYANAGSPMLFGETELLARIQYDPHELVQKMFQALDELMLGNVPESKTMHIQPGLIKGSH